VYISINICRPGTVVLNKETSQAEANELYKWFPTRTPCSQRDNSSIKPDRNKLNKTGEIILP